MILAVTLRTASSAFSPRALAGLLTAPALAPKGRAAQNSPRFANGLTTAAILPSACVMDFLILYQFRAHGLAAGFGFPKFIFRFEVQVLRVSATHY